MQRIDVRQHNRIAWNKETQSNSIWTKPVNSKTVSLARKGNLLVFLTEQKPVPEDWFPSLKGLDVLCLASGGGQQAPILAAAGASVTVLDNSPLQLQNDCMVAERENLEIHTVEGDMADLSMFSTASFDLIFHPVSNLYVPDIQPVWNESYRVLRHNGVLLAGFMNPAFYIFDERFFPLGLLLAKFPIPYSDTKNLTLRKIKKYQRDSRPLEFGHSLTDQIGGILTAGYLITDFYEDYMAFSVVSKYLPAYMAVKATKA